MSTDNHDKIRVVSWSRHDAHSFGDQQIEDTDANLLLETHFLNHPSKPDACVIRVTARALDPEKPIAPTSVVFYAISAPDELNPKNPKLDLEHTQQWGHVSLENPSAVMADGLDGDVRLTGHAASIGGEYTLLVRSPSQGTITSSSLSGPTHLKPISSATGSRAQVRARSDKVMDTLENISNFHVASSTAKIHSAFAVEKTLQRLLEKSSGQRSGGKPLYTLSDSVIDDASGVFVQRLLQVPFEIDASFVLTENREKEEVEAIEKGLTGEDLDAHLTIARNAFETKFDNIFALREKGVSEEYQNFAKIALSNVLGGIGFFHGSSIVRTTPSPENDNTGIGFLSPVSLFTATPSRAAFPRGFLWDEGFHQLIVQRWDADLSRECLKSWMALSQKDGWIPREQILGIEARARFPEHVQHLMVQDPLVANPPTILMPLRVFASLAKGKCAGDDKIACSMPFTGTGADSDFDAEVSAGNSSSILSQAIKYYTWLKTSQSGILPNSFRWRGRSLDVHAPDGYPLTLASGLDDYPRAEVPSNAERHVDLHCWMAWAAGAIAQLSNLVGKDSTQYWEEHETLKKALVDMHGVSGKSRRDGKLLCDYDGEEKICHEGYATILPLALGLLDPSDTRVGAILDSLESPSLLRARAGIMSLSKNSKWHRKGDDYWTGSVWMPFNFLTLAALRTKYSVREGPYKIRAQKLSKELLSSIVDNAFQVFSRTGQLWENYSPGDDGEGKSGRQFTGWSSLILLMLADMFEGVA